jgi:hypothetical protein
MSRMHKLLPDARDVAFLLGWCLVSSGTALLFSAGAGLIVAGAILLSVVLLPLSSTPRPPARPPAHRPGEE